MTAQEIAFILEEQRKFFRSFTYARGFSDGDSTSEFIEEIKDEDLTVGDVVLLESGDKISADLRIIEAVNLKSQESALTGESVPVEKMSEIIDAEEVGVGDNSILRL